MDRLYILLFLISMCCINPSHGSPFPVEGTVKLQLDNFMEFAQEPAGSIRRSNSVNIRGISWQLGAELTELADDGAQYLGLHLYCSNNCKIDAKWNCFSSMEIRITVGDYPIQPKKLPATNFTDNNATIGITDFFLINDIIDLCCFAKQDTIQIEAVVKPDQPCGNSLARNDKILVKDKNDQIGTEVKINKNLLAAHSNFFNDLFNKLKPVVKESFSTGGWTVTLDYPSTVEHFEQMMDVLHFGGYVLNDENLEDILALALQFQLYDIEGKCGRFLGNIECKIPTMKKYLIADKYGLNALKEFILNNFLVKSDFDGQNFLQNLQIFEELSDVAKKQLKLRVDELFKQQPQD